MINTDLISPYFSVAILTSDSNWPVYRLAQAAKRRIQSAYSHVAWLEHAADHIAPNHTVVTCFFRESHQPSWAKASELLDIGHHYFTISVVHGFTVIHSSDNGVREAILEALTDASFSDLKKIDRSVLNAAFLSETDIKTLWLFGVHRRTGIRPDTKTLTGSDLRYAINPIVDRSYAYNAARSAIRLTGADRSVGVNLHESTIWVRACRTWTEFLDTLRETTLVLHLARNLAIDSPIRTLTHPVDDLGKVCDAYDFTVIDADALPNITESQRDRLRAIEENIRFDVDRPMQGDSVVRLSIHTTQGGLFYRGIVEAEPELKNGRIRFNLGYQDVQPRSKMILKSSAERLFNDPSLLQAWFESGHCITGGQCYAMSFSEERYPNFRWGVFKGFDVTREKPQSMTGNGIDLNRIGAAGDDSLFSWVLAALRRPRKATIKGLDHLKQNDQDHWLLCDDGAGEAADFVHMILAGDRPTVTFIHVKAANSSSMNRKISVTAHEIVLSQAAKNVHLLDTEAFLKQMRTRISSASSKIAWNGSTTVTGDAFVLAAVNAASTKQFRFHTVVVQPHTRRRSYISSHGGALQRRQLDSLLFTTQYAIAGGGAELSVIGSADI